MCEVRVIRLCSDRKVAQPEVQHLWYVPMTDIELPDYSEVLWYLEKGLEKIREVDREVDTELDPLTRKFSRWYESMIESYEMHGMKATPLCMKEGERERALQNKLVYYEQQYSSNDFTQCEYRGEVTEKTGNIMDVVPPVQFCDVHNRIQYQKLFRIQITVGMNYSRSSLYVTF